MWLSGAMAMHVEEVEEEEAEEAEEADDEDDAIKTAQIELNKMPTKTLLAHDQYEEPVVYELSDWNVLGIEEAFGFENTPEDLKEANRVAWNVEDEA